MGTCWRQKVTRKGTLGQQEKSKTIGCHCFHAALVSQVGHHFASIPDHFLVHCGGGPGIVFRTRCGKHYAGWDELIIQVW